MAFALHHGLGMNAIKNLALALAIGATAFGCASDGTGDDDGMGGEGGGGEQTKNLDAAGRYAMTSTFDVATNIPGKVGAVTNAFIAMTDGPADPSDWLLEQIIAKMPSGTYKNFLTGARPFIAGYLNERVLQIAPDFVSTMVQVGQDFGQVTKNFGLNETLVITGTPGAYTAAIVAVGVHTKIDSMEQDVAFSMEVPAQTGAADSAGIGVTLDPFGKLDIAAHKIPLPYGQMLKLTLDKVIIPGVDPTATNLSSLLKSVINCSAVGTAINAALVERFGIGGGAALWTTACNTGLDFGASAVYSKIDSIDSSKLEFGLAGSAQVVDTNGDKLVDRIQTGAWNGTLSYAGTPTPLSPSTFIATRAN